MLFFCTLCRFLTCLFSDVRNEPQLPYTVETQEDNPELFNFRQNEAVQELRDQYAADLIVLVGVFPQVCGRA